MKKHLLVVPNRCTGCNRCTYACSAVKEGLTGADTPATKEHLILQDQFIIAYQLPGGGQPGV